LCVALIEFPLSDAIDELLISVVSVVGMSSLLLIGADRSDPMPSKKERQGRSANIFFVHEGLL